MRPRYDALQSQAAQHYLAERYVHSAAGHSETARPRWLSGQMNIHIFAANVHETVVGEEPLALCPGRPIHGERIPSMIMGFGDGHHRCPGSYLAIQETDIFLHRLLALDSLHMERIPTLNWNELTTGYEIRNFMIAV